MAEFRMPSLGADMEAGTLVKWLVEPGDAVRRGDIVAVVQTEKADIDVEVFTSGTVETIHVAQGQKVPVGTLLATIRGEGEEEAAPAAAPAPAPAAPLAATPGAPPASRARISPAARRRAGELGIDPERLRGTGPDGSITVADVEAAGAAPAPAAVSDDRSAAMRRAIAAAMTRSHREIPHYYLGREIDLGASLRWLSEQNAKRSVTDRILPAALLLRSVARAVREVPEMNGFWTDGAFRPSAAVHVGVAISLREGGLVAPALHDADRKGLEELMRDLSDLVARARAGSLRSSEVSDPTITVTNLGDLGAETVYGVIFPPQVALVGFGRVTERARVRGETVAPAPAVTATLAADHRASDGHRGGLFLAAVDRLLQKPEAL
ncbi:MAG: dihydrolipoamide acetyltransferase family protein [Acidobacteriota bacterium]